MARQSGASGQNPHRAPSIEPRARRSEELLDAVIEIITRRGFSEVRMSDLAWELSCSMSSLYKLAPNKDSLVVLAIGSWGAAALGDAEAAAAKGETAGDRARQYLRSGAESVGSLSHEFRRDVQRFQSARLAYQLISDDFVDRVTALLEEAARVEELRPINPRFVAGLLQYVAAAVRDEPLLDAAGMNAGEAILEIEKILWQGLRADDP